MQTLRQEEVQRAEGTSQLQDWNMECKDLESRRKIRVPIQIINCYEIFIYIYIYIYIYTERET